MARGRSRKKTPEPKKEQKTSETRGRKPKRHAVTSKGRTLTHPVTGDKIVLQPYDEYPEAFRYMAKLLYITGQASLRQISKKLNIPVGTLQGWQTRDKWMTDRREVQRLASREAVQSARRAMSRYIINVDRGLNKLFTRMETRLTAVTADDKIKDEGAIVKHMLDIIRLKIQLYRALTVGNQGQMFQPEPENFIMDGTEAAKQKAGLATSGAVDEIFQQIPGFLQEAAKYVLAMDVEDLDPQVVEAVDIYLENLERERRGDTDDEDNWMENPEEDK